MSNSKVTIIQPGPVLIQKKEWSQFPLGNNRYDNANTGYTAGGGGATLKNYLALGRINATGKVVPLAPTASDGSQYFYGFLDLQNESELVVAGTATTNPLTVIISGRVDIKNAVWPSGVTLDTPIDENTDDGAVSGRTVRQMLLDKGFSLIETKKTLVMPS